MSWHSFQPGHVYPLAEVVAACERRLTEGAVRDAEGKRRLVNEMRSCGHDEVIWSPPWLRLGGIAVQPEQLAHHRGRTNSSA
jgi:hypothetical protein